MNEQRIRIRVERNEPIDGERLAQALLTLLDELDPISLERLSREGAARFAELEREEGGRLPEAEAC